MAGENEEVLTPDDDFAAAFGEAVAAADGGEVDAPKKKEDEKDEPANAADDKKGGEAPAADGEEGKTDGGDKSVAPSGEDAQPTAGTEGAGGDDGKPRGDANQGDGSSQIAELTEAIKKLVPVNPQPPADKQPDDKKPDPIPEPELYQYTEDEKKVIESYAKEWDEHDKAWQIRERKLTHDLTAQLSHKFTLALGAVLQQIEQGLAPLYEGHVESAQERHFSTIRKEHSDFDQIKPELQTWIKQQPKYLQPHLQKTYDEGATADVIELVANFKTATGRAQPQPQGTPPSSSKGAAPQKDVVPANKAAELAPVESRRTPVQPASSGTVDKSDFDAGWEEAQKSAR